MDFQSNSEIFTENVLPFTDKVSVALVHICLQPLHLLALHFEIVGCGGAGKTSGAVASCWFFFFLD